MSTAIAEYLAARREDGLREGSVTTLGYRLRAVLRVDDARTGGPLADLTPARAAHLLHGYRASVDTRVGALAACRGFGAWCARRRYLRADPFADCKVTGRKRRGKPQLTADEGRAWYAVALELAAGGDRAALAALLCLLLGCRASEVLERTVRDVDERGSVLVVTRGKTAAAARRLLLPAVVRPLVATLREGRPAGALLFARESAAPTRDWLLAAVRRICRAAQVTEVCTHSLRGLQATLATAAHATAEAVAAQLGHTSPAVTARHYLAGGAAASARAGRALTVLAGGRS